MATKLPFGSARRQQAQEGGERGLRSRNGDRAVPTPLCLSRPALFGGEQLFCFKERCQKSLEAAASCKYSRRRRWGSYLYLTGITRVTGETAPLNFQECVVAR